MSQVQEEPHGAGAAEDTRGTRSTEGKARPPSRKRARKADSSCPSSSKLETSAKRMGKGRQTAGSLSGFMHIPLDVFFEVAADLHPLDMLHLARTSKSLRSIVLAKGCRPAWIASLATLNTLPACPSNMSEPYYAALLFDHHCFLCAAGRARWVDYAIRLRLCKTCHKANIRRGSAIVSEGGLDLFRTLPLFPCETGSDLKRAEKLALSENRTAANKYYTAHVNAIRSKYANLQQEGHEAVEVWVRETLEDVAEKHTFASTILAWFRQRWVLKRCSDVQTMLERKSRIVERLRALGYHEYDFPDGLIVWDQLMNQPKTLTDRTWNSICPKLEEQLAIEKERRLQEDFEERSDARLDVLVKWYEEYLYKNLTDAEIDLVPNQRDARYLRTLWDLSVADCAEGPVSRRDFRAYTEEMLLDADAYKIRAQRELADILRSDQWCADLDDVPDADVLQRPYAYFACVPGCAAAVDGCAYLTYEQLHAHWRVVHADAGWLEGDNDSESVEFALEAVGIAFDTARETLDGWVREGQLFCDCGHPSMPLPGEMSWVKLLSHLLHHLHKYYERKNEMKWLGARRNPNHVLRDGHWLGTGDNCCVKFLPEGADTAIACVRTTVGDACRAQIEAKLATRPDPGAIAVCRICKGLARKTPQQVERHLPYMRLPDGAEEIVWHFRYCHGKEFEKRDILFFSG